MTSTPEISQETQNPTLPDTWAWISDVDQGRRDSLERRMAFFTCDSVHIELEHDCS